MIETSPLHNRQPDDPIAWLSEPLNCVGASSGVVLTRDFMSHVGALSALLPDKKHAINLCENRYLFLVSLCACALRQQTNLMPSNKNIVSQQQLSSDYDDAYVLHDGVAELANLAHLNINDCRLSADNVLISADNTAPRIPLDFVAAICFTSGSTGKPKPNIKTWRTLVESSFINGRYMLPELDETIFHLATVPGQHMWGFETSVLLALFANVCTVDARPSFPQDITNLLLRMPGPRAMVATPLHLRALISSGAQLPELANVLCATAPLSQQLACEVERQFCTIVREVYGCSEIGSMATRRPAVSTYWEMFDGLNFEKLSTGVVQVSAPYLAKSIELEDAIEIHEAGYFSLQGRVSDQIKIAGKRGSLHEVNQVLSTFSGLLDGVVFFPEQKKTVPRLVALVVLKDGVEMQTLRAHFQKHLDSAFVPRPILVVPELPREASGKLIKSTLEERYLSLISK